MTGAPGIGKTTVIKRLAEHLTVACGFYTEEIRQFGTRLGFRIVSLDGKHGLLAHMARAHGPRVGKFRVDVEQFESIALPAIEEKGEIVLVDEIGRMELYSEHFKLAVERLFEGVRSVIATVQAASDSFVDRLKRRPDVDVYEVTRYNRFRLPEVILTRLGKPSPYQF